MERKFPIGLRLRGLQNEMARYLDQRARELGIDEVSMSNIWVLRVLAENGGHDVFQKDLEAECGLARSTVTGIVKQMERQGLIRRESVPDDLRLKKLTLTDAGMSLHLTMMRLLGAFERTLTRGFSEEELAVLDGMISRIQDNLR